MAIVLLNSQSSKYFLLVGRVPPYQNGLSSDIGKAIIPLSYTCTLAHICRFLELLYEQ